MKILYFICIGICALQLIMWILMPFSGLSGIYDMISKNGFYNNFALYARNFSLSERIGLSRESFNILNRFIALIYFCSLIFALIIPFNKFRKAKKHRAVFVLCSISLLIIVIIPVIFSYF